MFYYVTSPNSNPNSNLTLTLTLIQVTKALLDTSRAGYLAANSASSYSLVSMVSRFAPIMNEGGSVISLTYVASDKVIPGYGGGMSSAKASLESDTRVLAFEVSLSLNLNLSLSLFPSLPSPLSLTLSLS
jgi:NAD(P)-dependent dehydrogenase (short-subunit alcohol dehydrogenase family)